MLSLDELAARAASGEIDTVVAGFTDHHGRLCGKRFAADFFLEHVAAEGTHGCDYLLTTDLEMEPVPGYEFAGWDLGYGDVHLVPDLATLRVADWLDRSALVLCDVHHATTHEPTDVAPRTILRRQVERARRGRATRRWPPPSSSTTCSARATATRPPAATPTSSRPAGTSRTTSSSRARAPRTSTPRSAGTSPRRACRWRARRASGASASTR